MSTIVENLNKLVSIKADIRSAIVQKGGVAGTAFETYGDAIRDIPTGNYELEDGLIQKLYSGEIENPRVSCVGSGILEMTSVTSVSMRNVETIYSSAFGQCNELHTAYFPNCTRIENSAFVFCSSLSNVNFDKVKYIGENAFYRTIKLSSFKFNNVEYIGGSAFEYGRLMSVSINSIFSICHNAFRNNETISYVNLPNTIFLDNMAFYDVKSLKYINIPNVLYFGSYCFTDISNVETMILNDYVFIQGMSDMSNLIDFSIPTKCVIPSSSDVPSSIYNQLSNANKAFSSLYPSFSNATQIIDSEVLGITSSMIRSNNSLTDVSLAETWVLGNYAFARCTKLQTVTIPNLKVICSYAFSGCQKLESVDFPNVVFAGMSCLSGCTSLSYINLPMLSHVPSQMCYGIGSNLKEVKIPNAIEIGASAFMNCSGITSFNAPNLLSIGSYAFTGCFGLTELSFNKIEFIGSAAFNNTYISKLTILTDKVCKVASNYFVFPYSLYNRGQIFVPSSLVDAYKVAYGWSSMSSRIFPYEG